MTTYAPSGTSKRVGNKRAPILNLSMTPAERSHFTLPTGGKSTQKERLQNTSGLAIISTHLRRDKSERAAVKIWGAHASKQVESEMCSAAQGAEIGREREQINMTELLGTIIVI
jgi:hypothetical protein